MKRIFLIICLALFSVSIPAFAELTTNDVSSDAYLKNHGHSSSLIWATKSSIARVNGEPIERPDDHDYDSKPVIKYVRKFFMYIDPALDDHKFMNNHDINMTTRYTDL